VFHNDLFGDDESGGGGGGGGTAAVSAPLDPQVRETLRCY
jgi:hypothetical protein